MTKVPTTSWATLLTYPYSDDEQDLQDEKGQRHQRGEACAIAGGARGGRGGGAALVAPATADEIGTLWRRGFTVDSATEQRIRAVDELVADCATDGSAQGAPSGSRGGPLGAT